MCFLIDRLKYKYRTMIFNEVTNPMKKLLPTHQQAMDKNDGFLFAGQFLRRLTLRRAAFKHLASVLLALVVLVSLSPASAQNNPYVESLDAWAETLERFVDEQGRIDFVSLSKEPDDLKKFVDAVAQVSPKSHPDLFTTNEQIIAYHVNAYNALAMNNVIDRNLPKHLNSFFRKAAFFKFHTVVIGGKKTNLYDYENRVIRPLGEARVHFVLNCMVVDCPQLPMKVFTPESLETDLQVASKEFFNREKHVQIDEQKKVVLLSAIMKFYTEDYVESGKKQDLIAYANQFREQSIPLDYKVKFLDYDWTINQSP